MKRFLKQDMKTTNRRDNIHKLEYIKMKNVWFIKRYHFKTVNRQATD
jgi:hypothetical protein